MKKYFIILLIAAFSCKSNAPKQEQSRCNYVGVPFDSTYRLYVRVDSGDTIVQSYVADRNGNITTVVNGDTIILKRGNSFVSVSEGSSYKEVYIKVDSSNGNKIVITQ